MPPALPSRHAVSADAATAPPVAALQKAFNPDTESLLLAISGGGDSMALALAAAHWRGVRPGSAPLRAMIVDHGMRIEAAGEARATQEALTHLGIHAAVRRLGGTPPRTAIQQILRERRYRLLADEAGRLEAAHGKKVIIVTAHHADDLAETVLMRLGHGSGLRGLCAMREAGYIYGAAIARPFLALPRATLRTALAESGLAHVEDPANRDLRFERVRARQTLSAHGTRHENDNDDGNGNANHLGAALLRLAESSRRLHATLLKELAKSMKGRMALACEGRGWFDRESFAALPATARHALLYEFMRGVMPNRRPVKQSALARLDEMLLAGRRVATLGGCEWRLDEKRGRILVLAEASRLPPPLPFDSRSSALSLLFDDRWRITIPRGHRGIIMAAGAERIAAMRREGHFGAIPPRALWRMPMIEIAAENPAQALEKHAFIPHLPYKAADDRIPPAPPQVSLPGGGFTAVFTGRQATPLFAATGH